MDFVGFRALAAFLPAGAAAFAATLVRLLVDLPRLLRIELRIHGNAVKLEPPHKVGCARGLDFIQEEGLLRRVPVGVAVVDLTVGAPDVCAHQDVLHRLPAWRF
eukprot:CAMPEP_0185903962 /NCGR_PEP_ID=MMETSP0196C-20130402/3257_1 /TAXON_ID=2932 /ORGANISM="Alexandrium fundyense, Strain CCMP1719" /LENGTH=103 /DNA_ID=CAMNT_0028623137 /DNA_START=48 /DNA_END=358 /DNA_ORIENTATION=+